MVLISVYNEWIAKKVPVLESNLACSGFRWPAALRRFLCSNFLFLSSGHDPHCQSSASAIEWPRQASLEDSTLQQARRGWRLPACLTNAGTFQSFFSIRVIDFPS